MKRTRQITVFTLALLVSMASAHAQSPREQLKQMVEQLQSNPSDTALREAIIKLAREVKPAPAVSEETERRMARGEAAFESAKDVSGYDNAMREFEAAADAAPWYSSAYFNLGVTQEKAGRAKAAMESFRFYLLAAPEGKDAADVKKRIYKLEYAAEQARDCPDCPEMVTIPGKHYALGKYEVTQGEWEMVMGSNPSPIKGANLPVEEVSWNSVQDYIKKLNEKTGKRYRLPTEAEWEHACYGGRQVAGISPWQQQACGGDDINALAWYSKNSGGKAHPVGQKQANGYGLYDMSGNVWEWMEDCRKEEGCATRVLRGGSWRDTLRSVFLAKDAASADGRWSWPRQAGFRLAKTLP